MIGRGWHANLPYSQLIVLVAVERLASIKIELHDFWIDRHDLLTSHDEVRPRASSQTVTITSYSDLVVRFVFCDQALTKTWTLPDGTLLHEAVRSVVRCSTAERRLVSIGLPTDCVHFGEAHGPRLLIAINRVVSSHHALVGLQ